MSATSASPGERAMGVRAGGRAVELLAPQSSRRATKVRPTEDGAAWAWKAVQPTRTGRPSSRTCATDLSKRSIQSASHYKRAW
eukprot:5524072-Alexandrium_andersonii.AAC.1